MTICHLVLDGNRATPIKPTRCFDGCAFQPVRGVLHPLHRYIGSSMPPLSQPTRRGATLLRHAHGHFGHRREYSLTLGCPIPLRTLIRIQAVGAYGANLLAIERLGSMSQMTVK